ncbi:Hypothetical protein Y17_0700 [Pectobacterium wasabiae CFBP 3304]|nr:Hypothetical protein Y17_0700 [Pectobacterium wasabiae CFBP 3304]
MNSLNLQKVIILMAENFISTMIFLIQTVSTNFDIVISKDMRQDNAPMGHDSKK